MKLSLALVLILSLGRTALVKGRPKMITPQEVKPFLAGERPVRIGLAEAAPDLALRSDSALEVKDASGNLLLSLPPAEDLRLRTSASHLVLQAGRETQTTAGLKITPSDPTLPIELALNGAQQTLCCPGSLEVLANGQGLRVINVLSLEDYVAGVVPNEMPASFHPEALKAQAIIARTYALYNLGRHAAQGYDLCSQVHCQVYRGLADPALPTVRAARETAGAVLTSGGFLVNAIYHSTCGGLTEQDWHQLWGTPPAYLSGSDDLLDSRELDLAGQEEVRSFLALPAAPPSPAEVHDGALPVAYCERSPRFRWEVAFTYEEANDLVAKNLGRLLGQPQLVPGPLEFLQIKKRSPRGRVQAFEVRAGGKTYTLYHDEVRWLFGEGKPSVLGLPSTLFLMQAEFGQQFYPSRFIFSGAGWGHGLGLCQWGAQGRALAGADAIQILQTYYPGSELTSVLKENAEP